ncbi:MAG TPA: TetR/AcrR family transcriptional regulator [Solirubrobacteraceae bacterium]|jgi:AcrR family transcriptional regulator|nr:TetR/AcrR family transcriptional regulator [Solirubrobacteraceae bacterium]
MSRARVGVGVMARRVRSRAVSGASVSSSAAGRRRAAGERRAPAQLAARGGFPRDQVSEIQRSRLLVGAVGAIEEYGYARTTVAQITARARVSRRTFYELFEDRDACLAALLEDVVGILEGELAQAELDGLSWRERVRGGLGVVLAFFDREPALARVCVVQGLRGGQAVLECREAILTRIATVLDEGRGSGARASDCSPLTAEGLVGAAFAILHARLLHGDREPLAALTGELMGLIVLPYLGPAAARREQTRPTPSTASVAGNRPAAFAGTQSDPLREIPMRLTYRTARVLQGIAQRPGVNNRQVAEHAGVQDQGQISKLLARLERLGLTANGGEGHAKGEPNAWTLTPLGWQVAQRLQVNPALARESTR